MAILYYTAKAKDGRTLELPEEAQALGLRQGDEVKIAIDRSVNGVQSYANSTDEALAIIRQITEHHRGHRITDDKSTQRLLEEARGGAAYGYEPTE